jgi:nicotinamidase-related amidase
MTDLPHSVDRLLRLRPEASCLVIIDVQERLAQAMPPDTLALLRRAVLVLGTAAKRLGVPVLVTEQYPQGLGSTLADLEPALVGAARFEKTCFSAVEGDGFAARLREHNPTSVVVVGMEAHVCVFQTTRDLSSAGFVVHIPFDGVCSRREDHKQAGLGLCTRAGAVITSAESVVFDWLGRAGTETFRDLSKLVR